MGIVIGKCYQSPLPRLAMAQRLDEIKDGSTPTLLSEQ